MPNVKQIYINPLDGARTIEYSDGSVKKIKGDLGNSSRDFYQAELDGVTGDNVPCGAANTIAIINFVYMDGKFIRTN